MTDERPTNDSADDSRGGDGGGGVHVVGVTYDPLGNEQRKAVCELRRIVDEDKPVTMRELADAVGMNLSIGDRVSIPTCMRLIHLLGGDQTSGIDVLNAMDADGTRPNDDTTSSITHELREWMSTVLTSDDYAWAIADRIDERARLGAIKADTYRFYANQMREERDELMKQRAKHDRESDQLRIEKLVKQRDEARAERDELQAKLDAVTHYNGESKVERLIELILKDGQIKKLQAKLDAITEALHGEP